MKRVLLKTLLVSFFTLTAFASTSGNSFETYLTNQKFTELKKVLNPTTNIEELSLAQTTGDNLKFFKYYPTINKLVGISKSGYDGRFHIIDFSQKDSSGKFKLTKSHSEDNHLPPVIYNNKLYAFSHCSRDVYIKSLETGNTVKTLKDVGVSACGSGTRIGGYYIEGKKLYIIQTSRSNSPYNLATIDMKEGKSLGKNKGYYTNKYRYLTSSSSNKIKKKFAKIRRLSDTPKNESWTKELTIDNIGMKARYCSLDLTIDNQTVRFSIGKCNKYSKHIYLNHLKNGYLAIKNNNILYIVDPKKLIAYSKSYLKDLSYKNSLEGQIKKFTENIDLSKYDKDTLRNFAVKFPSYLSPSKIENDIGDYYTKQAESKYGLKLVTSIKDTKRGKRRVPYVSNTYYTSEDQSYYVNGQYIHKSKPKTQTSSSGGYDESIYGYEFLFAIDNTFDKSYIAEVEAVWHATEYYYKKERYCMKRGFFFCSDYGYRNVKKETRKKKRVNQTFIIGKDGRVKHSFYLGEKKPSDISFFISNIKQIDNKSFNAYESIMSLKGKKELLKSEQNIEMLVSKKEFSPFKNTLLKRKMEIQKYHRDIFSKENIKTVELDITVDNKDMIPIFQMK